VPLVRREVAKQVQRIRDRHLLIDLRKSKPQWALTKEEMKKCVWLKPELVAHIEFTEWTPDGHLRHSKFVGLREDKAERDVMREIEG
jgi:ATP-dependent DNA ligase